MPLLLLGPSGPHRRRRWSPPTGVRRNLPAELGRQGPHIGGGQVVSAVVDQYVSFDRTADIGPADRVGYVQRLQQWESLDEVQRGIAIHQQVRTLDRARVR